MRGDAQFDFDEGGAADTRFVTYLRHRLVFVSQSFKNFLWFYNHNGGVTFQLTGVTLCVTCRINNASSQGSLYGLPTSNGSGVAAD